MKRVIIESPYAGDIRRNTAYARLCLRDSLLRGEAPLASHLLYPQVLCEEVYVERQWGIEAGLNWMERADLVAVYRDFGLSRGMQAAITTASFLNIPVENRYLIERPDRPGEIIANDGASARRDERILGIRWWQRFLPTKPMHSERRDSPVWPPQGDDFIASTFDAGGQKPRQQNIETYWDGTQLRDKRTKLPIRPPHN